MRMKYDRQLENLCKNRYEGKKVYKKALYSGFEQTSVYKRYVSTENMKKELIEEIWDAHVDTLTTDEYFDLDRDEWMANNKLIQQIKNA